eukprot:1160564-Pelagomonas_calceolata.AAC.3
MRVIKRSLTTTLKHSRPSRKSVGDFTSLLGTTCKEHVCTLCKKNLHYREGQQTGMHVDQGKTQWYIWHACGGIKTVDVPRIPDVL